MLGGNSDAVTVIVTGWQHPHHIPATLLSLSGPVQGHPAQIPGLRTCPSQSRLSKAKEIQVANMLLFREELSLASSS